METRFWFSRNLRLTVDKFDEPVDGKLFRITQMDGTPFSNAGILIKSCPNFWDHCLTREQFDARVAAFEYTRTPEYREEKKRREAEKLAIRYAESKEKLAELQEKYESIPVTEDNIRVVIRFLSSQNYGVWDLPKMEIGYSANQFDCDGKIATTMTFDKPISIDGRMCSKFVVGAPAGYLTKYVRL